MRSVYLNKTQHFAGVAANVWNFHISGYQVCQKWLKERLMARVEEAIEAHGGWPLT